MDELRNNITEYFKTKSDEAKDNILNVAQNITTADVKQNETLFNALIPKQGKADTIAGEILRAIHKIGFRYYKEKEHYFEGAGIETSGSSAVYLTKHTNQIIANYIMETAPINYIATGDGFDDSFETIVRLVTLFLTKTPQLFMLRNTVDSTADYTTEANSTFEEYDSMLNDQHTEQEVEENEEI